MGVRRIAELPKTIGDWSLTQITAGLWLSTATADVPADVLALAAEPGRPRSQADTWREFSPRRRSRTAC